MLMLKTNNSIHTPYHFSSFESISQAVSLAKEQNISILGINDFNTTEGYEEFAAACEKFGVYPLFNIEFASLYQEDQKKGFHWNDPISPGVIFLCGKALNYPVKLSADSKNLIAAMWKITQDRIWKMLDLLNKLLADRNIDLSLDYNQIRNLYAKNSVREYHLTKYLYSSIIHKWSQPQDQITILRNLFNDPSFEADLSDKDFLQDQIHKRLLDTGKTAYIEENHTSFLSTHQVRTLILDAGGIPCLPIFNFSIPDIANDQRKLSLLARKLNELGIFAVEFFCNGSSLEQLKKCACFFHNLDFCVTLSTDHNAPGLSTLVTSLQSNLPFDPELQKIAYEGACILAAHQEKHRLCCPGFINDEGNRNFNGNQLKEFVHVGDEAIRKALFRPAQNC